MQDTSSENNAQQPEQDGQIKKQQEKPPEAPLNNFYYVQLRANTPSCSAASRIPDLSKGEVVMIQTDHGLEPSTITGCGPADLAETGDSNKQKATYLLTRRANREEIAKFKRLVERENEAFSTCQKHIEKHQLPMKLTRVERFFNGSKIIFYFTAENRVDFRELVKDLVQEFRTRVEIRQIGVRHETKMIGGLGCCGRELCCSSFIKDFAPVSIKMAKEQSLPLNPAKISGVCNRLLCCLTYEYKTYHKLRKGMPKPGKIFELDGVEYKVTNCNILNEQVTIMPPGEPEKQQVLSREEWIAIRGHEPNREQKNKGRQHKEKKAGKHSSRKNDRKDGGSSEQNEKREDSQTQDESS